MKLIIGKRRIAKKSNNSFGVTHLSPFPPQVGGVSVFVSRLHKRLLAEGIDSRVAVPRNWQGELSECIYRRKGLPWRLSHLDALMHLAIPTGAEIVHCHEEYLSASPILLALRARGKMLVLTVHSPLHCISQTKIYPWQKLCSRIITTDSTVQWVAVSSQIADVLKNSGVTGKINILPAYLSDSLSSINLPKTMVEFMRNHDPVIFVYSHSFNLLEGRYLYGFDEAILMLKRLLPERPKAGLMLICSNPQLHDGKRRLRDLFDIVMRSGVTEHCYWHLNPLPSLLPILTRSAIYLRPSLTDGDSVLIREAIAAGCKVVASDVVKRPEGVFTYALHNKMDMDHVIKHVLKLPFAIKYRQVDIFADIMKVYRTAINNTTSKGRG